jgi:long-chain fatty acid transport protein
MIMIFKKARINGLVAATLLVGSGTACASGFALIEQSGSGLGNAYAGGAASAEDASTIFYNPAGMSRLSGKQITVAGSMIKPSAKFSDTGSTPAAFQTTNNGNGGDAGSWGLVPNAYFAMEVNPQTRIGLGINAPFGLKTEYDANWIGRFQAKKSKIQTVNLNPSVSFDVNEMVSLGAGLNYQRITGDLTSAINWAAIAFAAAGGGAGGLAAAGAANAAGQGEGVTTVTGDDSAWGYNLGALFKMSEQTRVGLAYRSKINYKLTGSVSFSNRPTAAAVGAPLAGGIAAAYPDGPVSLDIKMPDSFSASMVNHANDKFDIMADATWTGWSVFNQLNVVRGNGTTLSSTPENWKNTWRFAVGATYHYDEQWLSRIGVAYDQTPVSDKYRTARIPDNSRKWLSLGGQYKFSKVSALDFGYAHLFVKDATINQNQTATGAGNLVGTYKNSVDILSVQYTQSF